MPSAGLSDTCDAVVAILEHDFGIPELWKESRQAPNNFEAEMQYVDAAAELAQKVDRLVHLNRIQELVQQDSHHVQQEYSQTFGTEMFARQSDEQIRQFLGQMAEFKQKELGNLLACTLPMLRSVFQDNQSLTDAELSVLNNTKKMSSAYNTHPANVRLLIPEYEQSVARIGEVAQRETEVEQLLREKVAPHAVRLRSLAGDLHSLENTFHNQFGGADDKRSRELLREHKKLEQKTRLLSIFTDLLPQMVLCLPTNWYEDAKLHAIVTDCQELSEKLGEVVPVSSMQEALTSKMGPVQF